MKKYICPNCESRNNKPYCNDCDCSIPNDSFIKEEETIYATKNICSACGRTVDDKRINCPHCGELLLKGTKYKTSFSGGSSLDSYDDDSHIIQYVVSVLIPLLGFIMGVIYLSKEKESHVGSICIALGFVSFVISYVMLLSI